MRRAFHSSAWLMMLVVAGCGGGGGSGGGSVENGKPIAFDRELDAVTGVTTTGTLSATDPDGDSVTFSIVSQPSQGTVELFDPAGGSFRYQATADAIGLDTFTYQASDGKTQSNVATVTVHLNSTPVAKNGVLTTKAGDSIEGTLSATDPDGDSVTFSIVSQPSQGTVELFDPAGGSFRYQATADAIGLDTFTFQASDGKTQSNVATVTVHLNSVPVAKDGGTTINAGDSVDGTLSADDADGDAITFTIVSPPRQGTLELLDPESGRFRYQSAADASGDDSFTFRAGDGTAESDTASYTIRFNQAPIAQDACYGTQQADPLDGLLHATDAESPGLITYELLTDGSKGHVQITDPTSGSFRYTPDRTASRGTDSFTFRVTDPQGEAAVATVTVIVAPKVMPLGDSITSGITTPAVPDDERVGYRRRLYDLLTTSGRPVDFVGSLTHGGSLLPDPQHEGHGGWRDDEIAWGRTAEPGDDGVYAWLTQNPADFILLHIGTNDINTNPDDVRDILDQIRTWSSDSGVPVTVLLARIIDFNPPDAGGTVTQFNDNVQSMAVTREDFDQLVLLDQQASFAGNASLYGDQLHPNETGYNVMAQVWYNALASRMPKCP